MSPAINFKLTDSTKKKFQETRAIQPTKIMSNFGTHASKLSMDIHKFKSNTVAFISVITGSMF